jgi:hypothetical protein
MSKKSEGKIEMPKFLKIPIIMLAQDANENLGTKKEYIQAEARINPFHISAYYPSSYGDDENKKSATTVICAGSYYHVDMVIEKFDELMNKTDKGINITET